MDMGLDPDLRLVNSVKPWGIELLNRLDQGKQLILVMHLELAYATGTTGASTSFQSTSEN